MTLGRVIHGDAREVLPRLDLTGCVVITDPPWPSGVRCDIAGAGAPAADLWRDVAQLLGRARAVVVYQSSLDPPFAAPPLPFLLTAWCRAIPPPYRGPRLLSYLAYVYGDPPLPPGKRCWPSEHTAVAKSAEIAARRASPHPCPMPPGHARSLVRWFGSGCTIVDPFAGSGTVLGAASELGQDSIGIDIDPRWIPVAEQALAVASRQSLIGPAAEGWR